MQEGKLKIDAWKDATPAQKLQDSRDVIESLRRVQVMHIDYHAQNTTGGEWALTRKWLMGEIRCSAAEFLRLIEQKRMFTG
jgi:hypothetical protein